MEVRDITNIFKTMNETEKRMYASTDGSLEVWYECVKKQLKGYPPFSFTT